MARERHVHALRFVNIEVGEIQYPTQHALLHDFASYMHHSFAAVHCLILHSTFPRGFYDGISDVKCTDLLFGF